jgi:hypothetical protein
VKKIKNYSARRKHVWERVNIVEGRVRQDRIDNDPSVFTTREFAEKFGLSDRTARARLQVLLEAGKLETTRAVRRTVRGVAAVIAYKLA